MNGLERAIGVVVKDCLAVGEGERLVVVCDETTRELAERMRAAGTACGARAELSPMERHSRDGEEPPPAVAEAMLAADVVVAATHRSLSHTLARRRATDAGARIATLPGVTADMLARAMGVDLREVGRLALAIAERLSAASEARITCERGSDLRLSLGGRTGIPDAGRLTSPGSFGNLPCGEGFVAPREDRGEGQLVVDGSIAGLGALDRPATLTIESGRLVAGSGEGERLLEVLAEQGGENVAELGVGCNGRARITGNILEDEKVMGTVHVAFGASASFGGDVQVPVHLDCVVRRPELSLDGEPLVSGGRLLV